MHLANHGLKRKGEVPSQPWKLGELGRQTQTMAGPTGSIVYSWLVMSSQTVVTYKPLFNLSANYDNHWYHWSRTLKSAEAAEPQLGLSNKQSLPDWSLYQVISGSLFCREVICNGHARRKVPFLQVYIPRLLELPVTVLLLISWTTEACTLLTRLHQDFYGLPYYRRKYNAHTASTSVSRSEGWRTLYCCSCSKTRGVENELLWL